MANEKENVTIEGKAVEDTDGDIETEAKDSNGSQNADTKFDDKDNAENTAIVESTTTDPVEIVEPKPTSTYRLPTTIILVTLGEILTIESEIAKAKTNILQLLHNVIYGKNGSSPQIKRNIRRFPGFEFPKNCDDYRKTVDRCMEYDLPKLVETAKILKLDNADMSTKELVTNAIMDFLMAPYGRTIAQEQRELKTAKLMERFNKNRHRGDDDDDDEEVAEDEEEDDDDEEEEEEEEPATKKKPVAGKKRASDGSRPKRATAARVWTNNYGSSDEEEDEEVEEEKPKIRKKNNKGGSDSGSDYNPSGGASDSEGDRRKSARSVVVPVRTTTRGRGRRRDETSEEEDSEESEEFSEEEVVAPKKKKVAPSRGGGAVRRGAPPARGRGRKRKQESSEEEEDEESEEEEEEGSDKAAKGSPKGKKSVGSTPKSAGRPKRVATSEDKETPPKKDTKSAKSSTKRKLEESESEDEPLSKKANRPVSTETPPTNAEIVVLLKKILEDANLEEITMKTVCKKVYASYPNHDLSSRKDFIKVTVKGLIAA